MTSPAARLRDSVPRLGPRFELVGRFRPFQVLAPGFVALTGTAGRCSGLVRGDYSPPAPFAAVEVEVLPRNDAAVVAGLAAANGDHLLAVHHAASRQVALQVRTGGHTTALTARRVRGRVRRLAFVLCENRPTALVDTGGGWRAVVTERHRVAPRLDFRVPETLGRFAAAWGSLGGTADLGRVRAGLFGMAGLRDLHLVQHADGTPYVEDGRMYLTATCAGLGFFTQAHWGVFAFDPEVLAGGGAVEGAGGGAVDRAGGGAVAEGADVGERRGRRELTDWLEQTAQLYFHRDGMLLGDHAGQIVRDGDTWHLAVSSWGDFNPRVRPGPTPPSKTPPSKTPPGSARPGGAAPGGSLSSRMRPGGVHVRHLSTGRDLLHGVHVLGTEPTPMPTQRGSYDPALTRIDGRWHVAYVESVSHRPSRFHPALAAGPEAPAGPETPAGPEAPGPEAPGPETPGAPGAPSHWTEGLRRVGEADELDFCEGPILARVERKWRVLASDGKARRYPVFDLGMRRLGDLDAPYGTNLPHPNVVDLSDGGRLLITFDGTQHRPRLLGYGTHGDVLVMRALG